MLKNKSKWWILFVTTTATSLFLLDSTLIPVALPTIAQQLHFSDVGMMWVINAYLLALSAFLLVGGKLCEILGFRVMFNVGLALFGIGALFAGCSSSASMLIFSRVLQGIGSACAFPATAALLVSSFPDNERARALGIDTGIASLFMILGPLLGGVMAQYLSWRYIFFFSIPLVIFGLAMSFWLVRRTKIQQHNFPLLPSLLMMVGVVSLIIGLMEGNTLGWGHSWVLFLTILGPIFMVMFIITSLAQRDPLADFTLFKNPLYLGAVLCRFVAYFIVAGTALWVIYFEKILSYSPSEIGIFVVAAALPVIALAPIAGYFVDRFGYRGPLIGGFTFLLAGLLWLCFVAHTGNLMIFLPGLCAFGMSLPFVMAPTLGLGIAAAPKEQLGSAAGMMMSVRQLASTMGVAVMTAAYWAVDDAKIEKP
nr:MFS transporter [Chlamydiota bacterium]